MSGTGHVLLQARTVDKSFGAVRALQGVSFDLRAGEVHGLMGENGAGKSTLIKVLTGLYRPDSGEIVLAGERVEFAGPRDSQRAGIAAVYQEINLIPDRSVADNLFLGREPRRFGLFTDRRRMLREARTILERYGLSIDPASRLATLGLGLQQMVSIARVVSLGARVVILDEPTSALAAAEVEQLLGVVGRLRAEGIGLVYVSHRLSECYRVCDRLTVLRDGHVVDSGTPAALPRARLIAAMLGRELSRDIQAAGPDRVAAASAEPVLEVSQLSWRHRVRDVSFTVGRGEVVGLAGLLGSGRTETLKATYGAYQSDAGTVRIGGRRLGQSRPKDSLRHGLAFLSEDRRTEGIFPRLSVRENLTAAMLPQLARLGVISRRKQDAVVARFTRELGIRAAGPGAPIAGLSGGNQQKVLIARALGTGPKVVMLDDPTRGIDVGAKAEVHRTVRALAAEGMGVVVTSSEADEVAQLAGRLVVLSEGKVAGNIETAGRDPDEIVALMAGS